MIEYINKFPIFRVTSHQINHQWWLTGNLHSIKPVSQSFMWSKSSVSKNSGFSRVRLSVNIIPNMQKIRKKILADSEAVNTLNYGQSTKIDFQFQSLVLNCNLIRTQLTTNNIKSRIKLTQMTNLGHLNS